MSRLDLNPRTLRRIHIIGGPGSGKSTLAKQLGACLGAPVYNLDQLAFEGVDFHLRPLKTRMADVHHIVLQPNWIAEGIFLGWTDELLQVADLIIWLDNIRWYTAAYRIVTRFTRWGVAEAKRQPGVRKFNRFGDYTRNLKQLVQVLYSSHAYYEGRAQSSDRGDIANSRAATAHCLEPYWDRVIHCRNSAEIQQLVTELTYPHLSALA